MASRTGTTGTARAASLVARFRDLFGGSPRVYRAPGRVNVIGEHTDYNDGFVMPAALALSCWTAAATRDDGLIVVQSANLDERVEIDTTQPIVPRGAWSDYVAGVASLLAAEGCPMPGASMLIESEIPAGAGLSSSAALEVVVATALLDLADVTMDPAAIAALCRRAEHEFVGAAVGIMDQFIAVRAREGTALMLDCRSLDFRLLPLPAGVRLVACDTMVRHAHAGGEYNVRRAQCEEAVRVIASTSPDVRSLRDVDEARLEAAHDRLPPLLYRRARHVVTENARVVRAAAALERGDLADLGALMAGSHRSLRDDYEVSCPELDVMVEIAAALPGVHGARMTGGGFGGSTVNLVHESAVDEFRRHVAASYERRTGRRPGIYVAASADGAERIDA